MYIDVNLSILLWLLITTILTPHPKNIQYKMTLEYADLLVASLLYNLDA